MTQIDAQQIESVASVAVTKSAAVAKDVSVAVANCNAKRTSVTALDAVDPTVDYSKTALKNVHMFVN